MTTLAPYPAYKDSGVEWLGDVPEQWDLTQLARLADERKIKNEGLQETTVLSLSYGRIIVKASIYGGLSPADYSTYQIVDPGSTVLRLTDLQNDQRSLRVGLVQDRGIITSAYVSLKPSDFMEPRFLYRMLHDFDVKKMFYGMGAGVRQGLSYKELRKTVFAVPDLDEQRAIADFLDGMDARITRFLAARRRMIALLEEQKQVVINQAVTRGLDPDVPLKDSGVEWLGEIPAHWDVRKVGALTSLIQTGPFGSQLPASEYEDDGVPLINPSHISEGKVVPDSKIAVGEATAQRLRRHRFRAGDIALGRRGEMGRCAVVQPQSEGWLCGTGTLLVRPIVELASSAYLQQVLSHKSLARWLELTSAGATMSNLNTTMVASIGAPVPPLDEQRAIVEHIDHESSLIDAIIARHRREIELMQEYRTRLISDVVTGKLDVRGVELPAVEEVIGEEIEAALEDGMEKADEASTFAEL